MIHAARTLRVSMVALATTLGIATALEASADDRHATWKKHQMDAVAAVQNQDVERAAVAIDLAMNEAIHFPDMDRRLRGTLRQFGWLRSVLISGGDPQRADRMVEGYVALAEAAGVEGMQGDGQRARREGGLHVKDALGTTAVCAVDHNVDRLAVGQQRQQGGDMLLEVPA